MTEKEVSLSTVSLQLSSDDGSVGINQYPTDNGQRIDLSANGKDILQMKQDLLDRILNAKMYLHTVNGSVELGEDRVNQVSVDSLNHNGVGIIQYGFMSGEIDLTAEDYSLLDLFSFNESDSNQYPYLFGNLTELALPNATAILIKYFNYEEIKKALESNESITTEITCNGGTTKIAALKITK